MCIERRRRENRSRKLQIPIFFFLFPLPIIHSLAVLPMFVNNDIRKEMYKGSDANGDAQFKKLYIYHMENVSILFADIKVSVLEKSKQKKKKQRKKKNLEFLE